MRYIEEGYDKDGVAVWFVLEGATLLGMYYTIEEAQSFL